jgi:hypothetical protein
MPMDPAWLASVVVVVTSSVPYLRVDEAPPLLVSGAVSAAAAFPLLNILVLAMFDIEREGVSRYFSRVTRQGGGGENKSGAERERNVVM